MKQLLKVTNVVDRLSRVQEKLSGFDYLSGDKIEELIKQDTEILWHEKKIQEGKDLWNAIKVTVKETLTILLYETVEVKPTQETYRSFDYSKEKRSRDLFTTRESL